MILKNDVVSSRNRFNPFNFLGNFSILFSVFCLNSLKGLFSCSNLSIKCGSYSADCGNSSSITLSPFVSLLIDSLINCGFDSKRSNCFFKFCLSSKC